MTKKLTNWFLLTFFLLPGLLLSQDDFMFQFQRQIDSLQKLIPGSGIEKQVVILNNLASCYAPLNFDSSIFYSSRAARLATNSGYNKGIGLARYNAGNAYYYKLDFKNALLSYLSAQSLLEKVQGYKELGDLNMMLGNINYFICRGDEALACYRKALGYYHVSGSQASMFDVYDAMSMAMYFLKTGPVDSTLVCGYKMLEHARRNKNGYQEAYALMQIGMFHSVNGISLQGKQKTLPYCDSALALASALNQDGLVSITYITLGNFYDNNTPFFEITGDMVAARSNYDKAYQSARKSGCSYLQAAILNDLVAIDWKEKKYNQAAIHLDSCETRLKDFFTAEWKNTPAKGFIINALGKMQDYFIAQRTRVNMCHLRFLLAMAKGETLQAVDCQDLYYQYRDTLIYSQQGRQIELIMAEDEADKQQQKMVTLARDNELNQLKLSRSRFVFIGSGTAVLLISVIFLLFFQRRKLRAEQRSVSMEQRLLRAQMNPHFIFNSLASIQNFVINENSDQASIYLSRFSQLVRNILDNSVEENIPLEKEISTIENYLELQKVRYAGKFEYKISVDEKIDTENIMIPPMLAQPFIENAIEHGIRHKETPGRIDIRFHQQDGLICFEVEDDGVGRKKAHEIELKHTSRHRSMATSITRDRLGTLNKKLKKKIWMEITDLKDDSGQGCGTRVEFGIPLVIK